MSGSMLLILAYGCLAVFLVAFVVRSIRIARLPVHLRWELAPVPKEKLRGSYGGSYLEEYEWWKQPREESKVTELAYMLREITLLHALREHNPALWRFSFPFHVGLYLLIVASGLLLLNGLLAALGLESGLLGGALQPLGGVGNLLGAIGALGLIASRALDPTLRRFTTPVAILNLVLLAAVFVTGLVAVLATAGFTDRMVGVAEGLLTAQAPGPAPGVLAAHIVVTLVFLVVLPFGQMMHFVAKYYTYHQVRWEDEPLEVGGAVEKDILELLSQPVTWAGPHVGADGKKNWVDLATQKPGKANQEASK